MSTTNQKTMKKAESNKIDVNSNKHCAGRNKPLVDITTNNLAISTGAIRKRSASASKKEEKISSLSIKCKKEIANILNLNLPQNVLPVGPKSASYVENKSHSKFALFEDKSCGVEVKSKTLKKEINNLMKLPALNKENKPKNVLLLELEWEAKNRSKRALGSEKETVSNETKSKHPNNELEKMETSENPPNYITVRKRSIKTLDEENLKPRTRGISPIRSNPLTTADTLISREAAKPKVKRRDTRRKPSVSSNADAGDLLDEEMLNVIIERGKIQEKQILLPPNFLLTYDSNLTYRTNTINWMLYVQEEFSLHNSEIYVAVSLLDQVLAKISVAKNMYQLVATTCIFLSNKFIGHDNLYIPRLVKLMNNSYSNEQMLKMERKILKILDYRIHSIEPSVFINSYLKLMNLNMTLKKYTIYFVLDHAIYLSNYSTLPTSLVAVAAILLSVTIFHEQHLEKVKTFFGKILTVAEMIDCRIIQNTFGAEIKRLRNSEENLKEATYIANKYKHFNWNNI